MSILSIPSLANKQDLLRAALACADRGWSIIPVEGKKAACRWLGYKTEHPSVATLRRLFARPNVTGLGVILGPVSGGLACRDWDVADAYHRWAAKHPDLASTLPTVKTSKGYHVYFRGPANFEILGDGEYRGDSGHYCVLPPSAHPSGGCYSWLVPFTGNLPKIDPRAHGLATPARSLKPPVAFAPLQKTARSASSSPAPSHATYGLCKQVDLPISLYWTLPTGPGQRNNKLFLVAQRLKALMPNASAEELQPIIWTWYQLALPFIRTKEWPESWQDFTRSWQRVKFPSSGVWEKIERAARAMPADPHHARATGEILNLCLALQAHQGEGMTFFLSCRKAGKFAGVSPQLAARVLQKLIDDDLLERIKPAGPKGSRQAAEYAVKRKCASS